MGRSRFCIKPADPNQLQNWPSDKADYLPLLSIDRLLIAVSAFITSIAPISVDTSVQPPAGTTTEASSGESIVVTDPNANVNDPVEVVAPSTGVVNIAAGTEGADIIVVGDGDAVVEISNAVDANGNPLAGSGSTFQIDENYQGSVVANLEGAITDGSKVDTSTETFSGNTIADAAPSNATDEFDFYVNTGAADDEIGGSQGSDFIRAGAGDDVVNAGAGNDIVRLGSGDDLATLGEGDDVAYFTIDQLQGDQLKVITDFDVSGDDKIQLDGDLEGLVDIDGLGTNSITINLSGDQSGSTTIVSEGEVIDDDDVEFV
ncbi:MULTISPECIES: calcium-binding protein [unclassified Synechococcus]|uniref:calcium-binding protein n=1 Tax=unclassified Synechococcus TaxID=2626047 RepID=UPI0039B10881